MNLEDIQSALEAKFLPSQHKDRTLPGGGRWFYVPHQTITDRLNAVCPGHWQSKVGSIAGAGDFTVVFLELTICGVTRTGVGDDKTFPETNDRGKSKVIGTPAVRAFRNAFKDAAEQFGICSYLDDQKEGASKQEFIRYMQGKGDGRAQKFAMENGWSQQGEPQQAIASGPIGKEKLMQDTTQEMKRLRWDEAKGRSYLKATYGGRDSRSKLTNNELSQFLGYLKSQVPETRQPVAIAPPTPIGVTLPQPVSVDENKQWLDRLTKAMKYNKPHADNAIKKAIREEFPDSEKTTADLNVFERNKVAGKILVSYGEKSNPKAESLYWDAIANNEAAGQLEPEELANTWLQILSGQTVGAIAS